MKMQRQQAGDTTQVRLGRLPAGMSDWRALTCGGGDEGNPVAGATWRPGDAIWEAGQPLHKHLQGG